MFVRPQGHTVLVNNSNNTKVNRNSVYKKTNTHIYINSAGSLIRFYSEWHMYADSTRQPQICGEEIKLKEIL